MASPILRSFAARFAHGGLRISVDHVQNAELRGGDLQGAGELLRVPVEMARDLANGIHDAADVVWPSWLPGHDALALFGRQMLGVQSNGRPGGRAKDIGWRSLRDDSAGPDATHGMSESQPERPSAFAPSTPGVTEKFRSEPARPRTIPKDARRRAPACLPKPFPSTSQGRRGGRLAVSPGGDQPCGSPRCPGPGSDQGTRGPNPPGPGIPIR